MNLKQRVQHFQKLEGRVCPEEQSVHSYNQITQQNSNNVK